MKDFITSIMKNSNSLIVTNASISSLLFFQITTEAVHFKGRLPINHPVTDFDIYNCYDNSKINIFTIYEEGFCYYSLAIEELDLVEEGLNSRPLQHESKPTDSKSLPSDLLDLQTLFKQEASNLQNSFLQSIQSTLPPLIEYAVKNHIC